MKKKILILYCKADREFDEMLLSVCDDNNNKNIEELKQIDLKEMMIYVKCNNKILGKIVCENTNVTMKFYSNYLSYKHMIQHKEFLLSKGVWDIIMCINGLKFCNFLVIIKPR